MNDLVFKDNFVFGCATAAYQIEGAVNEGGRGKTIWDDFSHTPGKIFNNENGDIACDSYHRYKEDIAILKELGFSAYRFSFAWSRIFPNGVKEINREGVDYYHSLLEELLKNNITPYVTLYHWDLPSALGDWTNRECAYAFRDYAKFCFKEYSSEVKNWITLNEPFCSSIVSHYQGRHAPGHQDLNEAITSAHHLNLAHGLAVQEFRKLNIEGKIGITINTIYPQAASKLKEDVLIADFAKACQTDIFISPIFKGEYPSQIESMLKLKIPIEKDDLNNINQKIDFIGMNYYSESLVKYDENSPFKMKEVNSWQKTTEMGWSIVPKGLLRFLRTLNNDTDNIDIYITENGMACNDILTSDMRVHDTDRIEYFRQHLLYCKKAIEEKIPLKGYFAWSLLDNFEWAYGYSKRFGITYVDYQNNCKRIIKDSGYFLRDVMLSLI
ncbi:MAG: GH1 family beta-glucosidase [Sphaerochaetaceae bacterium]|nr:GH1 family beta-glucosidase [Sphaerochaetaceae bacterium]MDC7237956.1 GH1 family beta-glucosidase [Sphaerochaetaceae bacterium]MDC7243753.1 GH1 family beta-glucosidase [Sphaerochaetaceae bacterium]MDC7249473.1 GH1 family beta-glucosidase [Sphaerochaetaceae bacterium]